MKEGIAMPEMPKMDERTEDVSRVGEHGIVRKNPLETVERNFDMYVIDPQHPEDPAKSVARLMRSEARLTETVTTWADALCHERNVNKEQIEATFSFIDRIPEDTRAHFIERGLANTDSEIRCQAAEAIFSAPEDTRAHLIERGLADMDSMIVRCYAAEQIMHAPEDTRAHLIELGLADENSEVRCQAAEEIAHAPEHTRTPLIEKGLADDDGTVWCTSAKTISSAPEEEQPRLRAMLSQLIEERFEDKNYRIRREAINAIPYAPEDTRAYLLEKGLADDTPIVRCLAADTISHAPEDTRAPLVEKGLSDDESTVWHISAKMISSAPEEDQPRLRAMLSRLIEEELAASSRYVREQAASLIAYAPEDTRAHLIEQGLRDDAFGIRHASAKMISSASEEEQPRLRAMLPQLIEEGLAAAYSEDRYKAAGIINLAPEHTRSSLIEKGLTDEARFVRRQAAEMISSVPAGDHEKLLHIVRGALEQHAIKTTTPLYNNAPASFFRIPFEKSGSDTTLLGNTEGGDLRERVILHHIKPEHLTPWQKAYFASDVWKEQGLAYIPIEPIVSYSIAEDGATMHVASRVLGVSLEKWQNQTMQFALELGLMKEKILAGLAELGIEHGHPHDDNFCLQFEKNTDGTPDLTKCPRLYLIDFDQSSSPSQSGR